MSKERPAIPIADAREISKKRSCPIVIIFGIEESGERYTITTYGRTKGLCAWAAKIAEDIHAAVLRGEILDAEHAENPYEEIDRLRTELSQRNNRYTQAGPPPGGGEFGGY